MVPATVTVGPLAGIVIPAIEKAEGYEVKDWPTTVNISVAVGVDEVLGARW